MKIESETLSYSPHMPRRGAPQAHGPASGTDEPGREDAETANTESCCTTLSPVHWLHTTFARGELTSFSNFVPQSRHSYSKMGMFNPLLEI